MKVQRETIKKITTVMLLAITVFVLMLAISEYIKYKDKKEVTSIQNIIKDNKSKEIALLVGIDDAMIIDEDDVIKVNNHKADFIMLFSIDNNNKTIYPIVFNKDLLCEYPLISKMNENYGYKTGPLSNAYSIGDGKNESLLNLKKTLEKLLGNIEIDYYISLDKDTISNINDGVGGVEIVVVDDMTDLDESLSSGQSVTLKGDQVKIYLKERTDEDTSVSLSSRQTQYLRNLYAVIMDKYIDDKNIVSDIYVKNMNSINSNCSKYDIENMFKCFVDYQVTTIENIQGIKSDDDFVISESELEKISELVK